MYVLNNVLQVTTVCVLSILFIMFCTNYQQVLQCISYENNNDNHDLSTIIKNIFIISLLQVRCGFKICIVIIPIIVIAIISIKNNNNNINNGNSTIDHKMASRSPTPGSIVFRGSTFNTHTHTPVRQYTTHVTLVDVGQYTHYPQLRNRLSVTRAVHVRCPLSSPGRPVSFRVICSCIVRSSCASTGP